MDHNSETIRRFREQLKASRLAYRKHVLRIAHMSDNVARVEAQEKLEGMEETNKELQESYLLATIAEEEDILFGMNSNFDDLLLMQLRNKYELSGRQLAQLFGVASDVVYQRIKCVEGGKA
ncbi:hypothetical protein PGRAN_11273 [Listeria grandensis FSL F6-0971]|uniref:Uncharacterized protein n=1 Tax=Listeria grandensis FSL F6-0971 TaxID=1265819 RepID=W7BAF8_9LIST|nr:hypothetical protein [Listeria grandensis]EUJ22972.1 hypothetical protein PGRAN_11273 [Listeria grandensis FSL F6-0971]